MFDRKTNFRDSGQNVRSRHCKYNFSKIMFFDLICSVSLNVRPPLTRVSARMNFFFQGRISMEIVPNEMVENK